MTYRNRVKVRNFLISVAAVVVGSILPVGVGLWTALPTVYTSSSTGKCVRVVNADGSSGLCSKVPDHYNHVWVW